MNRKKIFIQGMHCPSCEKLLEGEFRKIPGVRDVKVDRKTDSAQIYYAETEPDTNSIREVAEKFGYSVSGKKPSPRKEAGAKNKTLWHEWLNAGLVVLVVLFLFRIFQSTGLLDAINIKNTTVSYGVAILIGLVASVSSCLAVVGAVVIAFSEKYQSERNSFYESAIRPNIFFHMGRLGTFFALGGILGAVGGELNISGNFVSIYTIVIAVIMGWLGLNILGLLPSFSNFGPRMPKIFGTQWEKLKNSEHKAAPFILGGLTFFLPCGFTQSMQLFALASGSMLTGALSLFLFALGTVPALLVLGITASWTRNRGFATFQKVAGILIIIFAVYTFNSGLALKGVRTNVISSRPNQPEVSANNDSSSAQNKTPGAAEQIVTMKVTSSGFEPNILNVKQGVPVKWVIDGVNVTGCTSTIILPSFGISKNLKSGENIVQFTPQNKGNIAFSCGMGMVRGKFVVE